jgi:hypothetical protein
VYIERIPRMPRPGGFVCNRNSLLDIKPYRSIGRDLENTAVLVRYETVVEGKIRSVLFY